MADFGSGGVGVSRFPVLEGNLIERVDALLADRLAATFGTNVLEAILVQDVGGHDVALIGPSIPISTRAQLFLRFGSRGGRGRSGRFRGGLGDFGGTGQQGGQQGGQGVGRGQGNRGVRYPPNQRGAPEPLPVVPVAQAQPVATPEGQAAAAAATPATPAMGLAQLLAQANPDQQRMMLGEALYPLVEQLEPSTAGKVTGMLLEMDQSEVLHLIESPEALRAKVQEAMTVLQQAAQQAAQQQQTTVEEQLTNLNIA